MPGTRRQRLTQRSSLSRNDSVGQRLIVGRASSLSKSDRHPCLSRASPRAAHRPVHPFRRGRNARRTLTGRKPVPRCRPHRLHRSGSGGQIHWTAGDSCAARGEFQRGDGGGGKDVRLRESDGFFPHLHRVVFKRRDLRLRIGRDARAPRRFFSPAVSPCPSARPKSQRGPGSASFQR